MTCGNGHKSSLKINRDVLFMSKIAKYIDSNSTQKSAVAQTASRPLSTNDRLNSHCVSYNLRNEVYARIFMFNSVSALNILSLLMF